MVRSEWVEWPLSLLLQFDTQARPLFFLGEYLSGALVLKSVLENRNL